MSPAITFTEADTALIVAIINQLEVGKINKKKLQADLGLASIKTAESRLTRFKAKLAKADGQIPTTEFPKEKEPNQHHPRNAKSRRLM